MTRGRNRTVGSDQSSRHRSHAPARPRPDGHAAAVSHRRPQVQALRPPPSTAHEHDASAAAAHDEPPAAAADQPGAALVDGLLRQHRAGLQDQADDTSAPASQPRDAPPGRDEDDGDEKRSDMKTREVKVPDEDAALAMFELQRIPMRSDSSDAWNRAFGGVAPRDVWRFLIDRPSHDQGPLVFDKAGAGESFMRGMMSGFAALKLAVERGLPIDARLFLQLHRQSTDGAVDHGKAIEAGVFQSDMSDGFNLPMKEVSRDAAGEWARDRVIVTADAVERFLGMSFEDLMAQPPGTLPLAYTYTGAPETLVGKPREIRVQPLNPECLYDTVEVVLDKGPRRGQVVQRRVPNAERMRQFIEKQVNDLCASYAAEIESAGGDSEARLVAIARLCRGLLTLHPSSNGNQRVISFLLLQKLLIDNGFPPCIMPVPWQFDGRRSIAELVAGMKEGMREAQELGASKP